MIDSSSLPDQFPDMPPDLTPAETNTWKLFQRGWIPKGNDMHAPSIGPLYNRFTAFNVGASNSEMKAAIAAKYKAEAAIRRIAMQNPNFKPIKQTEVTIGVGRALDAGWNGQKQTATAIMREAANKEITEAYMSRTHQKGKLRAALAHHDNHPAVQYAKKQGNKIRVDADALSPGLSAIQDAAAVFRKLNDHEQRLNDMEARMRELEAFKASTEKRHAIEDAGQTPEQRVIELRKQGLGYKAISTATGTSQSTVRNWIKAHGL